jgi:hypothetical protein
MRSCKYSDVSGERRTKTLCIRNSRFHKKNALIPNESREIFKESSVSLTFEWQKKETRDDIITHQKSNDKIGHKIMCSVRAAAELVRYLYNCKIPRNDIQNITLNSIMSKGKLCTIPSTLILDRIRSAFPSLGKGKLGFTENKVGTYSNRSRGAMGMFLASTPVYSIMLIGRWSSDAFMCYIQKQVLEISHRVSRKMITYEEFYPIPDFVHNTADGDLKTRNNNNLATTTSFSGAQTNIR